MKREFIYGLIVGTIITILLIASMEYTRQTRPRDLLNAEGAKNVACGILIRSNCNISTSSILFDGSIKFLYKFDANKDGIVDSKDTLFELCKNYYGIETDANCKKLCGCQQ